MRSTRILLPLILLLGLVPAAAEAQSSNGAGEGERLASEGVYTARQATRGERVFTSVCQSCHTTSQFTGEDFRLSWAGRTVRDLFRLIRMNMPMENPGSLSRNEYIDVVSYLLKLNDYPAGREELGTDEEALRTIRIDDAGGGG